MNTSSTIGSARRPVRAALALVALALALALALAAAAPHAYADAGDIGVQGRSFTGTSTPTGNKRAESVLWFNDGSWWADMWDTTSQDFHIFRLDGPTQTWVDTGVPIDTRSNTHADVLWDGTHLYVASHAFVNDGEPAVAGFPSRLYRYSYDRATRKYSLDTGFPAQINNMKTETLSLERDSTGKLWTTWQQDNTIMLNRTTGDDRTWGVPFAVPTASTVTVDDTSALIAFAGRIGLMWSDQTATNDGMHFSIHQDGAADTTWAGRQAAIQGPGSGDDHMNLKALEVSGTRVIAAVKTSFTASTAPLIMLLVFDASASTWQSYTIARVSDCPNRVIVLVDDQNLVVHTYATYPAPPSFGCSSSGGAIYEKASPLSAISFPAGRGTLRILDADSPFMHNVSSTKQNVNNATGIALLAGNSQTQTYWHSFQSLGPVTPAAPAASFDATPTSGSAPLAVAFADTSTGGPTSWAWDFGDGSNASVQNPSHTYAAAGTYTVRLTAANAGGQSTATRTITVSEPPPPPPPPPGQIARESISTATATTATNSVTVATPPGTSAGDVLVACLALNGGAVAAGGAPAGWSPIASVTSVANPHVFGYYRVASGTEPAQYRWTLASSVTSGAGIARYSGAAGVDGPATTAAAGSGTSASIPGVTTTVANAMLVGCVGINSSSTATSIGSPAGMTQAWDIGGKRHELADGVQAAAGPSGTKAWALGADRAWAGWLVALRPR
jgi:PKD repeat protein